MFKYRIWLYFLELETRPVITMTIVCLHIYGIIKQVSTYEKVLLNRSLLDFLTSNSRLPVKTLVMFSFVEVILLNLN